jgi:hypothetical protein
VLCGEPGQGGRAFGDGVLVVFDEAIGEEDEGDSSGQSMVVIGAVGSGADAEGQARCGF